MQKLIRRTRRRAVRLFHEDLRYNRRDRRESACSKSEASTTSSDARGATSMACLKALDP